MRIINKKYLLIILLMGVILTGAIIFKPEENIKLDNVILKQEVNNKTFAMYKEESENNYVEVEGNKFPDMYVLNIEKSKCIDNNGKEVDNILSFNNGEVTITSGKTIYCYLYFDKTLGVEIKEKNPQGLSTDEIKGAMYRFQGQAKDENNNELVNNYICFGTNNKEECVTDTDHHMYRIIGIEAETGRVKVIKKEALNETVQWWNNYYDDIDFPESNIYKAISGVGFLENKDYVPKGWEEKISNNTRMYGDMLSRDTMGGNQVGEKIYLIETGKAETIWSILTNEYNVNAQSYIETNEDSPYYNQKVYYTNISGYWTKSFEGKVSLMYISDYYFSVSDSAICDPLDSNYTICKTGWMHLSQNDTGAPNKHEWTMSRHGWHVENDQGWLRAHPIDFVNGYVGSWATTNTLSVRPVFYINASEKLLNENATGTINDPFIIK